MSQTQTEMWEQERDDAFNPVQEEEESEEETEEPEEEETEKP